MIYFGALEKDGAATSQGKSPMIVNALPKKGVIDGIPDWGPMAGPLVVPGAAALPDNPCGRITVVNPALGTYETFVGTRDKIYRLGSTYDWEEIGSGYALPEGDYWSFAAFGNILLMTNLTDGILQYDMSAGGAITAVPTAPKCRSIAVMYDCVFAFSCDGNTLLTRNSALNNHTIWKAKTNGADYQPYPGGEELIGGAELLAGVAVTFQRDRISILNRDVSVMYTRTELSAGIGSVGHQSIVKANDGAYFISTDGIYFTNGGIPVPVGAERMNRTFLDLADQTALSAAEGAFDARNKIVWFRFKTNDDAEDAAVFSGLIGIDWQLNMFTISDVKTASIMAFSTPGVSLDDIDDDVDTIERSFDSRFYMGGLQNFACLDEDLKIAVFDGPNLAATLETPTTATPQNVLINGARPHCDAPASAMTVHTISSPTLGGPEVVSPASPVQPSGRAWLRGRGMNTRFRLNIAAGADWSFARGFDAVGSVQGGVR